MLIMTMTLAIGFASCSSDDDEGNANELDIVGEWIWQDSNAEETIILWLKDGGTCSYEYAYEPDDSYSESEFDYATGTWSVSDNKLKVILNFDDEVETQTYTIVSLKGNILVLKDSDGDNYTFER